MPHQCTDCGRQFDDGSKEMLSGCPDCGGNKFQFLPAGSDQSPDQSIREQNGASEPTGGVKRSEGVERTEQSSSVARTVGNAATAVRDLVRSSDPEPGAPQSSNSEPGVSQSPNPEPAASQSPNPEPATHRAADSEPRGSPSSNPDSRSVQSADSTTEGSRERETIANKNAASERTTENRHSGSATGTTAWPGEENTAATQSSRDQHPRTETPPTSAQMAETENDAQASARSELVSPDELPSTNDSGWERTTPGPTAPPGRSTTENEPTKQPDEPQQERPDLSELRAELNQQFESIKVLEPGQYELNLMELFDRQEYIIALQEDGKYTVQVPEHWQD